jgi:hypothetical protein
LLRRFTNLFSRINRGIVILFSHDGSSYIHSIVYRLPCVGSAL